MAGVGRTTHVVSSGSWRRAQQTRSRNMLKAQQSIMDSVETFLTRHDVVEQLSEYFYNHKELEIILVWLVVSSLNFLTKFPVEWLLFLFFTINVFLQAIDIGIAAFIVIFVAVGAADTVVHLYLSYEYVSVFASFVVHCSLIYGVHDFGLFFETDQVRGWGVVLLMISMRFTFLNPWPHYPPQLYMAPIASHCVGFGLCYVMWKIILLLYRHLDAITYCFGVIMPNVPIICILNVDQTSIQFSWTCFHKKGIPVRKYLVEINGCLVGIFRSGATAVHVTSLEPGTKYRIRVWSVSIKNTKSVSITALVKTLPLRKPTSNLDSGKNETHSSGQKLETPLMKTTSLEERHEAVGTSSSDETIRTDDSLPSPISKVQGTNSNNKRDNLNEFQTEEMILDEEISQLKSEHDLVIKNRIEIEKMIEETETLGQTTDIQLQNELNELLKEKKASEAPRLEEKKRYRALEESRREAEILKSKLEKELKGEINSKKAALELTESRKRELESAQNDLNRLEEAATKAANAFEQQRLEVLKEIQQLQTEIDKVTAKSNEARIANEKLRTQLAERRMEINAVEDETSRITRGSSEIEIRKAEIDAEYSAVYDRFMRLQEEHRSVQKILREESRVKMQLLQRLTQAKREMQGPNNKPRSTSSQILMTTSSSSSSSSRSSTSEISTDITKKITRRFSDISHFENAKSFYTNRPSPLVQDIRISTSPPSSQSFMVDGEPYPMISSYSDSSSRPSLYSNPSAKPIGSLSKSSSDSSSPSLSSPSSGIFPSRSILNDSSSLSSSSSSTATGTASSSHQPSPPLFGYPSFAEFGGSPDILSASPISGASESPTRNAFTGLGGLWNTWSPDHK